MLIVILEKSQKPYLNNLVIYLLSRFRKKHGIHILFKF